MRVTAMQGDTLDLLCYRHLGRTAGVTEQAYQLNPGLAAHGVVIAHGTAVTLPDPTRTAAATRALVQLWD